MTPADQPIIRDCSTCGETKSLDEFPVIRGKRFRKCRKCIVAKQLEWSRANRDRAREIRNAWIERHPDGNRKAKLKYWHSPRGRDQRAAWIAENRDKVDIGKRNAGLRRQGVEGSYTPDDIVAIFDRQKGRCGEPTCRIKLIKYHIDHIQPISRGGTNYPENLQLLCPSCNLRKHNRDPYEWARLNGRLF